MRFIVQRHSCRMREEWIPIVQCLGIYAPTYWFGVVVKTLAISEIHCKIFHVVVVTSVGRTNDAASTNLRHVISF